MEMDRQDSDGSDENYEEDGGGGSGSGGGSGGDGDGSEPPSAPDDNNDNEDPDSEGELYDIALAAAHSYMSTGMMPMSGRSVLEAGWQGRLPVIAHHGCVFPGETVPMMLANPADSVLLARALKRDRLFGLLCPDETSSVISGFGVLCEVFESSFGEDENTPTYNMIKARAVHRFRVTNLTKIARSVTAYHKLQFVDITVLPEISTCDTLGAARLYSLDPLRTPRLFERRMTERRVRSMEALATPWPLFVHDIFDFTRLRNTLCDYFRSIMLDKIPEDPVSLSFWVASNMALSARDRLALFVVDNALQRLHMECSLIKRKGVLCCSSCLSEIARNEHIIPMSSEGVHSNYVNLGGYMHDLLTVSQTMHISLNGSPTAEYSWFPGYAWTIANCASCSAHVGWRFVALKRTLRPQHFYGLCRNYVSPITRSEYYGEPLSDDL
ncbi:protein cereblon-like isoform X2 [Anticarsia gemmatalis]|uniref:protein cereblon-like isoform X2 n=1 Tax=Anticarsia gemmatalis TaxID=129554 RepID=UPI003F7758C0